jgi:hypothetical protein
MIENAKLKELSKSVLRVLREVKGEVCGVRRVVGEFWGNWGRVNGEFMKSLEKKIKEYLSKR